MAVLTAKNAVIGVTDSGLGGLTVLKELLDVLPNERFVFLADQAVMPYGDKSANEVAARVCVLAQWYREMHAKALVIACNTATALAATQVRQLYGDWPVVAIEPAVKPASLMTKSGRIGILATSNTLASARLQVLVSQYEGVAKVFLEPCPGLVELIENDPFHLGSLKPYLRSRLTVLLDKQVDVIVLGCTHYPFVRGLIEEIVGPCVQVIDTGFAVAKQVHNVLRQADLLSQFDLKAGNQHQEGPFSGRVQFFTTGCEQLFRDKISLLLGTDLQSCLVSKVII